MLHIGGGLSRPVSIALIAFLNSSIFCASFVSTWCSFRSLRNLSIHRGLGLIGFLIPFHIHCLYDCYTILIFNNHMGIPGNAALGDIIW